MLHDGLLRDSDASDARRGLAVAIRMNKRRRGVMRYEQGEPSRSGVVREALSGPALLLDRGCVCDDDTTSEAQFGRSRVIWEMVLWDRRTPQAGGAAVRANKMPGPIFGRTARKRQGPLAPMA